MVKTSTNNGLPEVTAEVVGCSEVHLPSKGSGEFALNACKAKQPWNAVGFELNEHVDIAIQA